MRYYDLTENEILDIQLGKIEQSKAIKLLIQDLENLNDQYDELLQLNEHLEMQMNNAKCCIDDAMEDIDSLVDDVLHDVECSKISNDCEFTEKTMEDLTEKLRDNLNFAWKHLDES